MADDDSEPEDQATKQVDREMLNRALNDSVDSHEVMRRVNAQLGEDLHDGGTAQVDRDSVAHYLEAARSGEFPVIPSSGAPKKKASAPSKGVAPAKVASPPPPLPQKRSVEPQVHPEIDASLLEPHDEATPSPGAAQRLSWSSGTVEVEPSTSSPSEPRMLTWILVLAAAGILLGIAMAVAWMALAA